MASENRCPKCNTPMETFSMILWDGSPHVEDACPLLDHDCLIKSLGRQLEEAKAVALASMERGTATDKEKCELARQLAYSESLLRASEARELVLQGKLDAAEAASEKDERDFLTVIDERDAREEVIGEAYQLVMDEWPDWSSDFGFKDALDAMNERLGADMRERENLKSERDAALAESRKRGEENLVLREEISLIAQRAKDVAAVCCPEESRIADAYQTCANELEFTLSTTTSATAQQFVEKVRREALEKAIGKMKAIVQAIPINDFSVSKGDSAYNWGRYFVDQFRAAILGEKEANDGHQDRTP